MDMKKITNLLQSAQQLWDLSVFPLQNLFATKAIVEK